MAGIGGAGILVDIGVIQKRLGRLKKFLFDNEVAHAKTLSTTVLADLTAVNVSIQAIVTNTNELSADPVLQIRDNPYQTANTH